MRLSLIPPLSLPPPTHVENEARISFDDGRGVKPAVSRGIGQTGGDLGEGGRRLLILQSSSACARESRKKGPKTHTPLSPSVKAKKKKEMKCADIL